MPEKESAGPTTLFRTSRDKKEETETVEIPVDSIASPRGGPLILSLIQRLNNVEGQFRQLRQERLTATREVTTLVLDNEAAAARIKELEGEVDRLNESGTERYRKLRDAYLAAITAFNQVYADAQPGQQNHGNLPRILEDLQNVVRLYQNPEAVINQRNP